MSCLSRVIFAVALVLFSSACFAPDTVTINEPAPPQKFVPSGFLSTYNNLTPSRYNPGVPAYVNEERPLRHYKMVILEPVQVHLVQREGARQVDPVLLQSLARHLENEIRSSLDKAYPIVSKEGFGVLKLRAALTDATAEEPSTFWAGDGIAGLWIEAELLDSQTDEQVAAYADAFYKDGRLGSLHGAAGCNDARGCLEVWAVLLRQKLDTARGLMKSNRRGQIEIY